MPKHVNSKRVTVGVIVTAIIGFTIGQVVPPILNTQIGTMISKSSTKLNESTEEFSSFHAQQVSWPYGPCQSEVVSSYSGLSVNEAFLPEDNYMEDAILSERVLPWNDAQLTILLTVNNPNDSIAIIGLNAEVYEHQSFTPSWLVHSQPGGCGGAYQRNFALQLETGKGTIRDRGIMEGVGEKPARVKDNSITSQTWTVSQQEISELTISVTPTDGYYEFGITIHYLLNGTEFERTVGSKEKPYKVIGGTTEPDENLVFMFGGGFQQIDP